MIQSKQVLKTYFEEGDKPTQQQFADLIDSMVDNDQVGYPPYSTENSYQKGDIVNYEGKFYKFITSHQPGPWVGTDVEETSIGVELNSLSERSVTLTKEEFDSLKEKDSDKLYFILEE